MRLEFKDGVAEYAEDDATRYLVRWDAAWGPPPAVGAWVPGTCPTHTPRHSDGDAEGLPDSLGRRGDTEVVKQTEIRLPVGLQLLWNRALGPEWIEVLLHQQYPEAQLRYPEYQERAAEIRQELQHAYELGPGPQARQHLQVGDYVLVHVPMRLSNRRNGVWCSGTPMWTRSEDGGWTVARVVEL